MPKSEARSARLVAADVLVEVLARGRSLSACLPEASQGLADARDRALAQELCYGVLRWLPRLDVILAQLLAKPLRARDADVRALLLLGLYQLTYTRLPAYAAVSDTVSAVAAKGKDWARGLVNGCLRAYQRERDQILCAADATLPGRYAHPEWLIDAIRQSWPGRWRAILDGNNERAPMTLRVNARRLSRDAYLARLREAGIAARPAPHTEHGITLGEPVEVGALPGFAAGEVSVADGAAQQAVPLLAVAPEHRVLDACAAPGGKTGQLLEQARPPRRVVAIDRDPDRIARLERTLARLELRAEVACADLLEPSAWWDKTRFERILLDAPCTATGVIRRHPDIKVLRRAEDIASLAERQRALLDCAWGLLAPGGLLLYATCSILPQENQRQIERLLATHDDASERPISASWGEAVRGGRQILPGEAGMDGFFYALVEKR